MYRVALARRTMNIIDRIKALFEPAPDRDVLVYLGVHRGKGLSRICGRYRKIYCFEANPKMAEKLRRRFAWRKYIEVVQAAVTGVDGTVTFNISSRNGAASSVGKFAEDFPGVQSGQLFVSESITVPSLDLNRFLCERGVSRISAYVSDIQGYDLTVLKTMGTWIEEGRINEITSEVAKDRNIYGDLPDNSLQGFGMLLDAKYTLVAQGWSILQDGVFAPPQGAWEMDCRWRLTSLNQS